MPDNTLLGRQKDYGLQSARVKTYQGPFSRNKLGTVVHTIKNAYVGGISRRIVVQGQWQSKMQDSIQKITKA
jgi:hypothetical protein